MTVEEKIKGRKIGIVGMTCISVPIHVAIQEKFPNTFVSADWIFAELRSIKSPEEMENMRLSASIADEAFTKCKQHASFFKTGMNAGK